MEERKGFKIMQGGRQLTNPNLIVLLEKVSSQLIVKALQCFISGLVPFPFSFPCNVIYIIS